MDYSGVLFTTADEVSTQEEANPPEFFRDLNLDQVIAAITAHKQEYNLKPYYYSPLRDEDAVLFRQGVFRDLEEEFLLTRLKSFADKIVLVRRYLSAVQKLYYHYHKEGWILEAALVYCQAVQTLMEDFEKGSFTSRALKDFSSYLSEYTRSNGFLTFMQDSKQLKEKLESIQYSVNIQGRWVRVRKYEGESDYSTEVERTFEKFKQGNVKNYRIDLVIASGMNHIEEQILGCVAKLYPEIFKELDQFCARYTDFIDPTIQTFDRQIQFYISYLDFIEPMKQKGLAFSYPFVSAQTKIVGAINTFDIALANARLFEVAPIVCNDFYLEGSERIILVSGPNQGGKTTFARMFGQLHYLACLGCPVPGENVHLFLFDQLFTHFEKEEDIRNLRGKLQDELVRIHAILKRATPDSIIIMNEIFTSTTLKDAIFLSKEIMAKVIELDALCVWVSFIDELSTLSHQVVSMVSTVVPEDPTIRTYKIIRKPADGLSYAICIAEKHQLTYQQIKERIAS